MWVLCLLAWYEKNKSTQQKHTFTYQKECTTTQKTKAFYDIWAGNGVVLLSKEKISKGGDK